MNPITFRGKDEKDEWIYGCLIQTQIVASINVASIIDKSGNCHVVKPKTIGHCANVHEDDYDEEFKEVWHGDILSIKRDDIEIVCEVVYETCGFMIVSNQLDDGFEWIGEFMDCDGSYCWIPDSKLLGNKFDNPELLEVESNG